MVIISESQANLVRFRTTHRNIDGSVQFLLWVSLLGSIVVLSS